MSLERDLENDIHLKKSKKRCHLVQFQLIYFDRTKS